MTKIEEKTPCECKDNKEACDLQGENCVKKEKTEKSDETCCSEKGCPIDNPEGATATVAKDENSCDCVCPKCNKKCSNCSVTNFATNVVTQFNKRIENTPKPILMILSFFIGLFIGTVCIGC